jgi:hypothetical protein
MVGPVRIIDLIYSEAAFALHVDEDNARDVDRWMRAVFGRQDGSAEAAKRMD